MDQIIRVAGNAIGIFLIAVYILSQRFPGFFQELETAAARERYKRSQLGGVDLKRLDAGLRHAMEEGQAYLNESLTLSDLAETVGLTGHQLSEYLNRYRETNFAGFINQYRIEEAKRLLREDGKANILSVAYKVGFNSKSAFNTSFRQLTGMSPTEFRREGKR